MEVVFETLGIFTARIGHAASSDSAPIEAAIEKITRASPEPLPRFASPREPSLLFADVFVPHRGIRGDVVCEQIDTFLRMQVDHFDAILSQPADAAPKIHRLADNQRADAELPHQSAAIPAGGQRGHHDFVPITALPPGLAK